MTVAMDYDLILCVELLHDTIYLGKDGHLQKLKCSQDCEELRRYLSKFMLLSKDLISFLSLRGVCMCKHLLHLKECTRLSEYLFVQYFWLYEYGKQHLLFDFGKSALAAYTIHPNQKCS